MKDIHFVKVKSTQNNTRYYLSFNRALFFFLKKVGKYLNNLSMSK